MSPRIETISEVTLYPDKAGWGRLLEGLLGLAKHHKGGASEESEESEEPSKTQDRREPRLQS